jgi:predicted nuclease of predicted toxin-antitoxin system
MRIYLDDNTTDPLLISELRKRGHGVVLPSDAALSGASDARHFVHAIREELVVVTRDYGDFTDLHDVVIAAGGEHPGIFLSRFDGDPTKDMKPRGMAAAVDRIEVSGLPLINQLFVLNHWRKWMPLVGWRTL